MQWFRKGDIAENQNQNKEGWWRDLRSLGLIENNKLNRSRLKKVAQFIWSQQGKNASFEVLLISRDVFLVAEGCPKSQ